VIVDTSVWVDYFAGRTNWQTSRVNDELSADREVGLTDIVYAEVLQGIKNDGDLLIVERRLLALDIVELGGLEDFRAAAELYRSVRRAGHTIRRTSDCLIAVACIKAERPLLHRDIDFDRIAEVSKLAVVRE
jgi:predicted nucleic acid-binding protein